MQILNLPPHLPGEEVKGMLIRACRPELVGTRRLMIEVLKLFTLFPPHQLVRRRGSLKVIREFRVLEHELPILAWP